MVPRSTVWEPLSFLIAEYFTELVVFKRDLLLPCALCFISSTGTRLVAWEMRRIIGSPSAVSLDGAFLLMMGNEGVILWFDIKEFSDFMLVVCLSWECAFWYAAKVDFWTFTPG